MEIADTVADPKTKLQARAIANDCYRFILEMSTNAGIVSDALKFVTQSEQKINTCGHNQNQRQRRQKKKQLQAVSTE